MSCHQCAKTSEGCGCEQESLSISQICNPVICDKEECSESFDSNCSIYTGADITNGNGVIVGTSGDNVSQILANIVALFSATNSSLKKSYVNDTGIGNDAPSGTDTLVFADTISKNTLYADGDELVLDIEFTAVLLGSVDIKVTLGVSTVTYTASNLNNHSASVRFSFNRIDVKNIYSIVTDNIVENGTTDIKGNISKSKIPTDLDLDQPLAVNISNSTAGVNQMVIQKISLSVKNL